MRNTVHSPYRIGGALAVLLVVSLSSPQVLNAGKGGGGGAKDVPLQIAFPDPDSESDRIRSDGGSYSHGVDGVTAYINGRSPRQITFDTNFKQGTPREVFLQFFEADAYGNNSLCAPHGECTPPFYWRSQPIDLRLGLVGLGTGITWQGMTAGQQAPGRVDLIFKDEAGGKHVLKFNPSGWEWTQYVTVTCAPDPPDPPEPLVEECDRWIVEAAPGAVDCQECGNTAVLLRHPKKGEEQIEGFYYMDFQMTVEVCDGC